MDEPSISLTAPPHLAEHGAHAAEPATEMSRAAGGPRPAPLAIAPEVLARLPGLAVVVVVAEGVEPRRPEAVAECWRAAWRRVHEAFGHANPQSHPHIAAWRLAMRSIGAPHKEYPTSVEALVRRALRHPEPFTVNPLVDFYNAVCLEHVVPAGGFDLDTLGGPLELRATRPGDTFQALDAAAPEEVPAGEIAYATENAIVTRHLVWRQSRRGMVAHATRRLLLVSEILPAHEGLAEPVRAALTGGLRELFGARVEARVLREEGHV
jgi:DNA/RNA-binding domain of Phe-tRNA-synthetase-like protein